MAVNNDNENTVFNLNTTGGAVSPDQTSMFEEENVTRMDIPHDQISSNTSVEEEHHEEEVSTGTKAKIVAALAIVGIAGYVAYWVQEPIQLRADVLDGTSTTEEAATTTTTTTTTEESSATVADASEASTGPSVSVDVSLFGFEPASLKIDKGTTVIWTNTSTEDQTIIGSSPEGESFVSPVLTSGQSFSYKFDLDSSFEYYSTYNPALKATLTVGIGSPVAPGSEVTSTETTTETTTTTTETANPDILMNSAPTGLEAANNALNEALAAANAATVVTDSSQIMETTVTSSDITAQALEDLKPAAGTPTKLSKTGPAENLYALMLVGIAWFNRKKLAKVFQK
jgi:plastocyanin